MPLKYVVDVLPVHFEINGVITLTDASGYSLFDINVLLQWLKIPE